MFPVATHSFYHICYSCLFGFFFICVFIYNDFNFRDGWMLSLQCLKPHSEACCCWLAFTLLSLCRAFSSSACFSSSHYSSVPGTSTSVFFSTGINVKFHKNLKSYTVSIVPLDNSFYRQFQCLPNVNLSKMTGHGIHKNLYLMKCLKHFFSHED